MTSSQAMTVIDGGQGSVERLPSSIWVEPWADGLGAEMRHDPRSDYAERYWLGLIGPTSLMCLRLTATELDRNPDGFEMDTAATAVQLGVSPKAGAKGLDRALRRLQQYQMASAGTGGVVWAVRREMPDVPSHMLARLPAHLRRTHRSDAEAADRAAWTWDRAAAVAATLGGAGEHAEMVAGQLRRLGVPAVMAGEAARHVSGGRAPAMARPGIEISY